MFDNEQYDREEQETERSILKSKIIIVSSILAGLILLILAIIFLTKDDKVEKPVKDNVPVEQQEETDDEDIDFKSESDAQQDDTKDALTAVGLPSVTAIQNNEELKAEYTGYLEDVTPLLNGLSVGFSVMYVVYEDLASMSGADALKADFNSSIEEYKKIFNALEEIEGSKEVNLLNRTLLSKYITLFNARKAEMDAVTEVRSELMIDYSKLEFSASEVNAMYKEILDIHDALTQATGVYIGDSVNINP